MTGETMRKFSSMASRDSFYLGWHLARYTEMKDMSMEELGIVLGCPPETVNSIALCRSPRPESPHFRTDIERVAGRFQVKADRLMGIVRYVQVASEESTLLAARDHSRKEDVNRGPDV